ncbi:MAG: glycoside hydrolase family 11 protein [Spirochaetales bacterium]|nr:glycoside hydrolase family 11 protein [Spirochaetales bacterium]
MSKFFSKKPTMILISAILSCFTGVFTVTAQTVCTNSVGTLNGYTYEFWKDTGGSGYMTMGPGAAFSVAWSDVNNILVRTGMRPGTKNAMITFAADFHPDGNSYLGVYGQTRDPHIEYYIIESWDSWRPPGGEGLMGTFDSDGATYDIYRTVRIFDSMMEPLPQYWSVRRSKRTSGTITVRNHFVAWEVFGMDMGALYEVSFCVEGIQSSGTADVYELAFGSRDETPAPTPDGIPGDVNGDGAIDILDALLTALYYVGLDISSTFIPANADVDNNGTINIMDALKIAQYSVGLITDF